MTALPRCLTTFLTALLAFNLIGCASVSASAVAEGGMTLEDIARLKTVGSARLSPGGDAIAYTLNAPREPYAKEDGPAWTELHVLRDGRSRGYVVGEVDVKNVRWHPAGDRIGFLAKRKEEEKQSVYLIPVDGGEARKVLEVDTDISRFRFSPDGDRIAFLAKPKKDEKYEKLEKKGFKTEVYEERLRNTQLRVAPLDGFEAGEPRTLALDGSVSELAWHPNGDSILIAMAPTPLIDDHYMKRDFYRVGTTDGEIQAELDLPGKVGDFAWSPNGEHLAYIAGRSKHDPAAGRLYLVDANLANERTLKGEFRGHVEHVAWRDAETVVYTADTGVFSTAAAIDVASGEEQTLVAPGTPILRTLSLSSDGKGAAFVADSPQHPTEVYAMDLETGTLVRETNSNPWLADRRLAKQEVIEFEARDGLKLQGILIRPLDEDADARYPTVLMVHGGPESHDSHGWKTTYSDPGQAMAARGYAALYPNYRGSTGRGVEYSKMGQNDYAGDEFDDLVDFKKHVVDIGLADPERVGITGGSYGGYASAWAATALSEHFAASVMFVGISDQLSKFGTTDIPEEMYLVHARKWPWDDWQYFLERSPIYHTDKAQTPLLIMHGKEDTRVHPGQSMEMYRYMKVRTDVPVRLVFFPGEGHGNSNAAHRYDYSRRLMRWMDNYLVEKATEMPPADLDHGDKLEEAENDG